MASNIINKPPTQGGAPPAPPGDLPSFECDEGPMRSELRRQIAALEKELATIVARSCPWEPRSVNPTRGPSVQSSSHLEQIRDELLASLHDLCRRIEGEIEPGGGQAFAMAPSPTTDDSGAGRGWRRKTRQ